MERTTQLNAKISRFSIIHIIALCLLLSPISGSASPESAFQWLAENRNGDGSYSLETDIATAYQATSEVLHAAKLNKQNTYIKSQEAIGFINTETLHSTEYLSRKIAAIAETGDGISSLLAELTTRASDDGGYGEFAGFQPTVLDTAFALQALQATGGGGTNAAAGALNYLLSRQKANGSWSDEGSVNNVYTTALAVRALTPFINRYSHVASSITAADSYLLSQQNGSGLWASDFESAQALLALVTSIDDRSILTQSINSLIDRQQTNGSWNSEVYSTALVLQLLAILDSPVANPGFSALQGKVVDGGTGYALSGTLVSIDGPVIEQTLTDHDGNFEFTDMPQGQYEMIISQSGYTPLSNITELISGKITQLGVLSLLPLTGNLHTATIMGTVTDAATGLPVAGVKISTDTKTTLTGTSGAYQLNSISPGLVTVSADVPGYYGVSIQTQLKDGSILLFSPVLTPGQSSTDYTYLFGTIREAETGLPLTGANVNIDGAPVGATDNAGDYHIEPLADGLIHLSVSLAGYDPVSATLKIASGNRYEFSPTLYRIDSSPPGANTSRIKGSVIDASTDLPLTGVSVKAYHDNIFETSTTGSAGNFNVNGIAGAELTLEFTHSGYQSVVFTIPVYPLTEVDIGQIRLRPASVTSLLPDLTVSSITRPNLNTDPIQLQIAGKLQVTIKNQGTARSADNIQLLAYYDSDRNNTYDALVDSALGAAILAEELPVNTSAVIDISLDGAVPFRDAPISVWVDSLRSITESNESNNQITTSSECRGQPLSTGTLDPVLKWQWTGSSYEPSYRQVMSTPVVAQLNDDNHDGLVNQEDIPDIVFEAFSGSNYTEKGLLRALNGKDGKEIWSIPAVPRWVSGINGPAVGDIDHDGLVEIIISGPGQASLMVFENTGDLKWSKSAGGAQPALADLDHDGEVEIIHGRSVFDPNGNILWTTSQGSNDPIPAIADLDNDGYLDVFAGGVAYNHDGTVKWNSGIGHFGSAIGNFDADSYPEIVVKTANSTIFLLEHNGAVKWGPVAVPGGGGGPITVADFDGDGQPEIGTAGASYYVVLETNGSIKWLSPTQDFSSKATGSSVFDFEGDGKAEVLYGDEVDFRIFDGTTGKVLFKIPNPSGTLVEYPVIADIDNDGHAEIIVVSNNYSRPGPAGIRVFQNRDNNWMPTRSIWNQHAYHINNINDDGTIPQYEPASWLFHNTYRLNAFAGRDALDQTDLTAGRLILVDHGFGQKPGLSVRIGNAGLADLSRTVSVAFYQDEPGTDGNLLGKLPLDALAAGDYKDVALDNVTLISTKDLYAVVDEDAQVNECDEGNNQVSTTINSASALGRIQVSLDAGEYGPDSPAKLKAIVQNTGALPTSFRAVMRIEDGEGHLAVELPSNDIAELTGGASTPLQQDWNTGLMLNGTYRLHGLLYDVAGNLLHENSKPFTIINGRIPALDVNVSADKATYAFFDQIQLTARLINSSQNTILPPTHVDIIIHSPDDEIVFNASSNLTELLPGALRDLPFVYNLRDALIGIYQVELRVSDSSSQQLLAVRHTAFTVEQQLVQALSGTVTASPVQQYQGPPVQCTETVTYLSDAASRPIHLISQLLDLENGQVIDEKARTVVIGKGQTMTDVRSITTDTLSVGAYACLLNGEIDGISRLLGDAVFEIKAPPVRLDAELKKGDRGRILVLLDPVSEYDSVVRRLESKAAWVESLTDTPSLSVQKHTLENLLNQARWSYTLVTDKDNFIKQLHTGSYTAYLLLTEHVKLDESVQKELREAVYRGEGLIEAGSHDQRQGRIDKILGIKFVGKQSGISGLTVLNTDVYPQGSAAFGLNDKTLKASAQNAKILGLFSNSDEPAMTTHQYGAGIADYFGFDLLAEISMNGADPLFSDLLLGALEHTHPKNLQPVAGGVYPLQLKLANRGIDTKGQAAITLPSAVGVIDKGTAALFDHTLIWPFESIAGQTLIFDSWISLPESPVDIHALIQTGNSPDFLDYAAANLSLSPEPNPLLTDLIADAQFLDEIKYKHVIKYLKWAEQDSASGNYSGALASLIRSSDALIDLGPGADAELHRHVAETMRAVAQKM